MYLLYEIYALGLRRKLLKRRILYFQEYVCVYVCVMLRYFLGSYKYRDIILVFVSFLFLIIFCAQYRNFLFLQSCKSSGRFIILVILADEMNQANDELRDTIRSIWPLQAKKMLDLLIPRNEGKLVLNLPFKILSCVTFLIWKNLRLATLFIARLPSFRIG